MNKLTMIIPYYENPKMLALQLQFWRGYSSIVNDKLLVILIDDGSPRNPAEGVLRANDLPDFEIQLYRIEQNIPWNYPGARNLGFYNAPDEWIYSSDMDHVMPWHSIKALLSTKLENGYYYVPARRNVVSKDRALRPIKQHSETYILTRDLFWKAGGYDEDYSGMYFKAPTVFRTSLNKVAKRVDLDDVVHLHYPMDIISDSQTTDYEKRPYVVKKNQCSDQPYLRFDWKRIL